MVVIAVGGCTGTGKSTLCFGLQKVREVTIVQVDEYHNPTALCPRIRLATLPWPDGLPPSFAARGEADFNVPAAIDWQALHGAILRAKRSEGTILIEGNLLYSQHLGALRVRSFCDAFVLLSADGRDPSVMERLWRRKWQRSHLGKPSYRDRGVTAQEYQVYWESYVWPRWLEHGACCIPPVALRINSMHSAEQNCRTLLGTGWLDA